LLFAIAIVRGQCYSAEGKSQFRNSYEEGRSSALDWFQNSQQMSQSSEVGHSKAFRPDHALPSFTRSCAVPPPPADIENLNLSQAFQTSSSSSQPPPDSAALGFSSDARGLDSSQFVSPYNESVSRKENNAASSGSAVFKVPYRNVRPVAKVTRQETTVNVASLQHQRAPVDAGRYRADSAVGSNAVGVLADDDRNGPQTPSVSGDSSSVIAKTPHSQPFFSGHRDSDAATPFPQISVIRPTTDVRTHVGDTPLALSGLTVH